MSKNRLESHRGPNRPPTKRNRGDAPACGRPRCDAENPCSTCQRPLRELHPRPLTRLFIMKHLSAAQSLASACRTMPVQRRNAPAEAAEDTPQAPRVEAPPLRASQDPAAAIPPAARGHFRTACASPPGVPTLSVSPLSARRQEPQEHRRPKREQGRARRGGGAPAWPRSPEVVCPAHPEAAPEGAGPSGEEEGASCQSSWR